MSHFTCPPGSQGPSDLLRPHAVPAPHQSEMKPWSRSVETRASWIFATKGSLGLE